MNKLKQKISVTSGLVLALVFGLPNQPVKASAGGCSFFGLDGNTCINVQGDGLSVDSVRGSFGIGNFQSCISSWYYRISYQDKNQKEYAHATGPSHPCAKSGQYTVSYNTRPYVAKEGRVCAKLYGNGKYIDAACVNITP